MPGLLKRNKYRLHKYANGGSVGDPKKKGPKLTYRQAWNTYIPSDDMSMEDIQRILDAQGGFPLSEAVVEDQGGPRIYSREGMSQFAKQGAGYGLEAARLTPFLGEALDVGDIVSASKTGKDLSGYDATPEGRAAMLGAGLLIPNIIEKPAKAAFKLLKGLKGKPVYKVASGIGKKEAAKNTIVKKAGGHTTGNRYYDFLESRHPEALKQIESGKLSIDDVVSDKNILNDYVNRLETSYRGVAAEGLDDATKFLSKHNPDMHHSRQQLGSGVYSSLTSEGALPYALENAVSENITPYLGRLRTIIPDWSENPRKLFKILKDRNLKGEYLDDPYGRYRGRKGFDAKKINQDPIYDAKYLGHRIHRPGADPILEDLVDLSKTKEWEKFKNLKNPGEDVIDNSYEMYLDKRRDIIRSLDSKLKDLNILRPSLKKGGKIRLLKK